jgi:hypothetical protein
LVGSGLTNQKTTNIRPLPTKDHQYETTPNQRPPILSGQISEH